MVMRQVTLLVIWLLQSATPEPGHLDTTSLKHIANVSYAENSNPSALASIFSPRMDFDQWKPLTGRGDPLRNDPTYDYEPPVLERVHYWAEDTRLEREHYPERKSEVLMLGISSRKPSVVPRPPPPRRHHRPLPPKYEDYSYKLSEHYPMTILVPPPLPPPGHKPSLFILSEEKRPPPPVSHTKLTDPPKLLKDTATTPEHLTSLYALQEANLIYQSSTTSQTWIHDFNQTKPLANSAVSSDYAGWGPTTPIDENDAANDTHNLISIDHIELSNQPYLFYKPMLSEAPPPPKNTPNPLLLPTFVPTALPILLPTVPPTTASVTQVTWPTERTTTDFSTDTQDYNEETTTERNNINTFPSTPVELSNPNAEKNLLAMLTPMMTMPLVNGPERLEDNLYAHASENFQVYKEHQTEDTVELETMQTMQPPAPPAKLSESTTISQKQPFHVNPHDGVIHKKLSLYTHDPYLHMRFTTPMPTIASSSNSMDIKPTTETPNIPMYLIIQGHSKVKTYGSKPKMSEVLDTLINEIPKPNESNEVKHLHPIKDKYAHKSEKGEVTRKGKAQNLKSLIDEGRGSIEIQETDVGIKYDVSDGSEVPLEIYRKGIVDNDENDYSSSKKLEKEKRLKRQIDLEDILPVDEDTLEEYVYNFLKGRSNDTGITGLVAQAVTGETTAVLDDLEDDDDDDEDDDDEHGDR